MSTVRHGARKGTTSDAFIRGTTFAIDDSSSICLGLKKPHDGEALEDHIFLGSFSNEGPHDCGAG